MKNKDKTRVHLWIQKCIIYLTEQFGNKVLDKDPFSKLKDDIIARLEEEKIIYGYYSSNITIVFNQYFIGYSTYGTTINNKLKSRLLDLGISSLEIETEIKKEEKEEYYIDVKPPHTKQFFNNQ